MEFIVPLVLIFSAVIGWILFFIINIKTVRRLRKNPVTRDELGFHLFWGWYALNISLALFVSEKKMIKRKNHSDGYLFANQKLVQQYTTPFEKIICKLLVLMGILMLASVLVFMIMDGAEYLMSLFG